MDAAADALSCPSPPATGDLPCDVSAVFQVRCQHCHTTPKLPPPNNAPFNLRTYEDLTAPFGITNLRRWQRVSQVIEPNNYPHMPPPGQPQLTDSDFATLHKWFADCAPAVPEGTGCDVSEGAGAGSGASTGDASTGDASTSDASASDAPAGDGQSVDDASSGAPEGVASDAPSEG